MEESRVDRVTQGSGKKFCVGSYERRTCRKRTRGSEVDDLRVQPWEGAIALLGQVDAHGRE